MCNNIKEYGPRTFVKILNNQPSVELSGLYGTTDLNTDNGPLQSRKRTYINDIFRSLSGGEPVRACYIDHDHHSPKPSQSLHWVQLLGKTQVVEGD